MIKIGLPFLWPFVFSGLLGILTSGCATTARQTESLLKAHGKGSSELPTSIEVPNVPFIEQAANFCGPATLAMTMTWAGNPRTADELAPQIFTPGAKGTFQNDMLSAGRRNGMLAIPLTGLPSLFREVAAGHPVIVFENLGLSWYPQWHYAVVYGFDLKKEEVLMHSGPEKAKRWSLQKFERSWELGDHWALVILPPNQLSATADELAHSNAAAALEAIGKNQEAQSVYKAITMKWPTSLGARIGLANLAFAEKNYGEAVTQLSQATHDHPDSAAAFHNLAIAQGAAKKAGAARLSARRTIELSVEPTRSAYRENLKDWL